MKKILFIRHAKSNYSANFVNDHERTLNNVGERDAAIMGKRLKKMNLFPDLFISSSAKRAFSTSEIIKRILSIESETMINMSIYSDGLNGIINMIKSVSDEITFLAIFGHKPTMHIIANQINNTSIYKFPTCSVLLSQFPIKKWKDFQLEYGEFILHDFPNNNIDVKIPLGLLCCVTGVSGSGKSTLINETLYPILNKYFFRGEKDPLPYKSIDGIDHLDKVIAVNQSPIGRTPRSNPATYTGVFSDIRRLFANLPEAKIRGYKVGRFSFNVAGGRCECCKGGGMKTIEMNFLPDILVHCEGCNGKRYNRETLEVRFKGKSIADVLDLTINHAVNFFEYIPSIYQKIKTLQDVGLGYISLGQSATTFSGGEAQRIKLATELSKRDTGNTFYILDEPTTGLHFQDIQVLLDVVNAIVDKGNTVLIIEHNMDVIKVADYIIDIGYEGGEAGGNVICNGNPEIIVKHKDSYTARYLKDML